MAFQSSTSISSPDQLIDALATFVAANGWTVVRNTIQLGSRTLTIRKAGVSDYIHIYNTDVNRIRMRASVGYDDTMPPSFQPGVCPSDSLTNNLMGPYPNVWFFLDGDEVNVVVRRSDTTGAYSHMAFGVLSKYGAFTGGTFVDGSYFNTTGSTSGHWDESFDHALFGYGRESVGYIRVDADSLSQKWHPFSYRDSDGYVANTSVGPIGVSGVYFSPDIRPMYELGRLTLGADANTFSGRSIIHPIEVAIRRVGNPAYFSKIGYVRNTRFMSMAKFDPEQELSIGSDTWAVFPVVRKAAMTTVSNSPNASDVYGYAIRKVP